LSVGYAKEADEMRLLYIVSKGMNDPTLASVPLHIAANGSLEVGQEVSVVLAGDATDLVIADNAQRMEELLSKLREHQVPVYVRKGCAVARGATEDSAAVVDGRWAAPPDVARLAAEADRVLTF
jgi:sulfur relay (sulfurtransferase) complex TusBCD TusD component (DsrE family)